MKIKEEGQRNPSFINDDGVELESVGSDPYFGNRNNNQESAEHRIHDDRKLPLALSLTTEIVDKSEDKSNTSSERQQWGSSLEFLMSCIAMSVGLGNVWRFPFTAYENGGGAFLIPYLIILFLVGKPFYFLEMIIGQFTSRSSVKMWSLAPGLKGVGWAQMFSMIAVSTYYCALMSVTLHYLISSFQVQLPWSRCWDDWADVCIDSGKHNYTSNISNSNVSFHSHFLGLKSSAELYFSRRVLKERPNIVDGLGWPDLELSLCLLLAWLCIFGVLIKGVKSSGKAAYFLALFPYIIMTALLLRAVTLEGAANGILFFIKPNWSKLFEAKVWYAAVSQCFFSLSVCFGGLITYSSYNDFRHNIYRDVIVVTSLDTLTSLIAGFTTFGILGNLAHELGTDDIANVVKGSTGLAFISYPDAIAKFAFVPQLFSVLFFLMLFVLGIGSGIALVGGIVSIINDQFPNWKHLYIVTVITMLGFFVGLIYCTPGGQSVLNLVDHYAASFVVFVLASLEVSGVFWLYGLENFLEDVEFMLGWRPSIYWRICWSLVTPILLITIFFYTIATIKPLTYMGVDYPGSAQAAGWTLLAFGVLQVPFWFIYTVLRKRKLGVPKMLLESLKPSKNWGPLKESEFLVWRRFKESSRIKRENRVASRTKQFLHVLVGREDELD